MLPTKFVKFDSVQKQKYIFNVDDIQSMHPLPLEAGQNKREQNYALWVRGRNDPIILDAIYSRQLYEALPESKDITVASNAPI